MLEEAPVADGLGNQAGITAVVSVALNRPSIGKANITALLRPALVGNS